MRTRDGKAERGSETVGVEEKGEVGLARPYLDTVWMTKTSLPRTDSWICTRVSAGDRQGGRERGQGRRLQP